MNTLSLILTRYSGTFHIFSAVLFLLTYFCVRIFQRNREQKLQRNIGLLLLSFTLISVCESVLCFLKYDIFSTDILYFLKALSLLLFVFGSAQWFLYTLQETGLEQKSSTLVRTGFYIPVAFIALLAAKSSPRFFFIEASDHIMVKGDLLLFWYLANGFYLAGSTIIALMNFKTADYPKKKQKLLAALFPVPVIFCFFLDKFTVFQFQETGFCIAVILYFLVRFLISDKYLQVELATLRQEKHDDQKKLAIVSVQAESANYAKSAFLFNMSHDVRTPLNAITGYTAMAMKYIDDKERVTDCISKINSSSQQLLKLMNRVLDMSRIESGDVCINEEPLDIVSLYKNAVAANQEAAHFRSIDLQFTADAIENNKVYADEVNINQIVSNIVGNAIKYTEPGGSVRCTLVQSSADCNGTASYQFITEDTGIGMSKDFISHIFEVFSREKTSTLSGKAGVGLGMSVVKRIVDKMGGEVAVSSELGQGTKVVISLQFRTISEDIKVRTFDPDAQDLNGRRVLIAEDNEMNREIAKDILEDNGLIVEEAEDGTIAVEKVIEMTEKNGPFYYDFILMDIQMPNMNGYDAAKAIRSISALDITHLPIIAMTANAFEDDRRKSFESGMDAHLAKPIDVDELLMTLRIFLR